MLRHFFVYLLLSGVTFILAACCGSVPCDKQDDYADALFFRFNLDSLSSQGFRRSDIDTVYIRRYTLPSTTGTPQKGITVETVQLLRANGRYRDSIVINFNTPFASANGLKQNSYRYTVYVLRYPAVTKPKVIDTIRYALDNIKIAGNIEGDGCCTYYRNTSKSVEVSQMPVYGVRQNTVPFNATEPEGTRIRNYFLLNRF
ncbi:MAG TPA: hypothetical protein VF598_04480 [Hymenobacter sp.]|jgi:hypothetical protein